MLDFKQLQSREKLQVRSSPDAEWEDGAFVGANLRGTPVVEVLRPGETDQSFAKWVFVEDWEIRRPELPGGEPYELPHFDAPDFGSE